MEVSGSEPDLAHSLHDADLSAHAATACMPSEGTLISVGAQSDNFVSASMAVGLPALVWRRQPDAEIIIKVENIVRQIFESLQRSEENIAILLKRKPTATGRSSSVNMDRSSSMHTVSFPGKTPREGWRFSTKELAKSVCRRTSSMLTRHPAVVLRILELIHEALVNNIVVSKR